MRNAIAVAIMGAVLLGGCGPSRKEKQARADARAANFVPPSVLSRLDFGGVVERRFRALDRNGDDFIGKDELPTKDSRLIGLDRNKDGEISASEWSEGMLNRFDRIDTNHDGSVTSTEREQFHARERAAAAAAAAASPAAPAK